MIKQVSKETERLKETVRELAAGQHDLHQRLEVLISVVAAIRDGNIPAADQAAAFTPPPSPETQSWRAQAKRVAKFVLRHTLGTARRIWDAASPDPLLSDQVILRVSESATKLPRLAVIRIVDKKADMEEGSGIGQALNQQTDTDFDRVVWHPGSGAYTRKKTSEEVVRASCADARGLARALDVDYLWTLPAKAPSLPATFIETGRLLLGSEPLPFVRFEVPGDEALFWAIPELWQGDEAVDLGALDALAKHSPDRLLGKAVDFSGGYSLTAQEPLGPQSHKVICRAGVYFVAAHQEPRTFDHPLATLAEHARSRPDPHERASVLIVVSTPLTGGVEETVATMVDGLSGLARLLVVNLVLHDELGDRRWRHLQRLVRHAYSLPELFAPVFYLEVLSCLIDAYGVSRLLHIGDATGAGHLRKLRRRFPALHIVDQPVKKQWTMADDQTGDPLESDDPVTLHLATTSAIDAELSKRHVADQRRVRLPLGLDLELFAPALFPEETIAELRRELGLNIGDIIVTMVSDLLPEKRPEDFLALAHRCRDDERFFFLLVGEGSLTPTLGDLHRCFRLDNFRLEPPRRRLAEYLAVTDILCTTAESEPWPRVPVAALAMARPVVAMAVDDLPKLLGDGPCGLGTSQPGDLDDLETAIRRLVTSRERRTLGERGPEVAARYAGREKLVEAYRRALDLGDEAVSRPEPEPESAGEQV